MATAEDAARSEPSGQSEPNRPETKGAAPGAGETPAPRNIQFARSNVSRELDRREPCHVTRPVYRPWLGPSPAEPDLEQTRRETRARGAIRSLVSNK